MNTMSKLPKIKYEELPDEIKDVLDEVDVEWESLIDTDYFIGFPLGPEAHKTMRVKSAKRMVAYRLWGEEMNQLYRKLELKRITKEECEAAMQEAKLRRDRIIDN